MSNPLIVVKCNVNKLHHEFVTNGLSPWPVLEHDKGTGEFYFTKETDMNIVQQIVDNHDPTPISELPTAQERLAALEAALLEVILNG